MSWPREGAAPARGWFVGLAAGAIVFALAAAFLVLPRAFDPRADEMPGAAYHTLLRFSETRTRGEVVAALALVDPERRLEPYFSLDDNTLAIGLAPGATPVVRVALRVAAAPTPSRAPRRIVLDPGHFGGAWSRRENRHVTRASVAPGPGGRAGGSGVDIVIKEGDLAWATAQLLQRELRARGAEVALTRWPPPVEDFPAGVDLGFDAAREAGFRLQEEHPTDPAWGSPLAPLRRFAIWRDGWRLPRDAPFSLYQRYDLRRRAAVAEAFGADLTLSLHYDATTTDQNGTLVFIPGNFVGTDLVTPSQRLWAFIRVLDGSLPEAARLARHFGAALMQGFDLPALSAAHDPDTGHNWRPVDADLGVYARNLAILRRTPGVVLLLEGPCVNQSDEYPRLLGREVEIDGQLYPARVREYADAVLAGLAAAAR